MNIVVQKFGGSSVATLDKIQAVAEQIASRVREGNRLAVVVSAMGKTTDELMAMATSIQNPPHRRELDMLLTAGERISMALLAMALHKQGLEAVSFTGSQSGIITEDSHQGARILEVRPFRLREALEAGKIVIVAGYQGVSKTTKEVTTLGRGGSDTTAVALAAALEAQACEIYSDVDGVYSADPRVCPQARLLPSLDYTTMSLMAASGAKVLNAEAVRFAEQAGIVVCARRTGDLSTRQTELSSKGASQAGVVAVIGHKHIACIRSAAAPSYIDAIGAGTALESQGQVLFSRYQAERWETLIDLTDAPECSSAPLRDWLKSQDQGAEVLECGLVTIVGPTSLCDMSDYRSSLWSWSQQNTRLLCARDQLDAWVNDLHAKWIEGVL